MAAKVLNIKTVKSIAAETIWPTRCAVCDTKAYLLCPTCVAKLSFIDNNKSCSLCGEPFGKIQCCGCSPIDKTLTEEEKLNFKPNYNRCISIVRLDKSSGRIVALYKDAGERRLSGTMAYFMAKGMPNSWLKNNTFITYIPASKEAVIRRGYDHCEEIAKLLAKQLGLKCINCFNRPLSKDQRKLGRTARAANLKNTFSAKENVSAWICKLRPSFIIIDDVYTTGSTLNAASKILKLHNASDVYCLTFARTF